ncbi:MAG: hypothetical protein JOY91_04725 [Sinobacteraceae bacterium]|nr:hypothetical protein [Nevskiaceae bacterium]
MSMSPQVKELLLQSLVQERGGVLVYRTALECVLNDELRSEWENYLTQTRHHVDVLTRVCSQLGLDPGEMTPGCVIVHENGKALVIAMKRALAGSDPAAAELVACECVLLAETKDHADWELIGACARGMDGQVADVLRAAYEEVEDQEDEHLYHTKGWCRELWLQSLGLDAVLPPPEETDHVKTAIEAARAEKRAHPSSH